MKLFEFYLFVGSLAQFDRTKCDQDYVIESRQFPDHLLTKWGKGNTEQGTYNGLRVGLDQVMKF